MDELTISITDEEYVRLSYMADYYGITLAELIKKYFLAQLDEDFENIEVK